MQRNWSNAFQQVSETLGEDALLAIGRKISETAKFPPEIDCIERALQSINALIT